MTTSGLVTPHSRPGTPADLHSPTPSDQSKFLQPPTSSSQSHHVLSGGGSLSSHAPTITSGSGSHPNPSNPSSSISSPFKHTSNVPSFEKPIYEQLLAMYKNLLSLKNNRSKYINSKEVYQIYHEFLNIINDLKLTRKDEELKGITLQLPNGNDLIIDDNFQLLSLCFVTCGLTKFAPATYSSLSTVMKLLTHLKECKVYTMDDLNPVGARLEEIRNIILNSHDNYQDEDETAEQSEHSSQSHQIEETLLRNKLNKCETLYDQLVDNFKNFPSDLEPVYHELVDIRQQILNLFTDYHDDSPEKQLLLNSRIAAIKQDLKNIEKFRDEGDGKFHSNETIDEHQLDSVQPVLNGLIDDCNNLISDLQMHDEELSLECLTIHDGEDAAELKNQYDALYRQLQDLKSTLDNLLITRRWTLRETDLYSYQKSLKSIDEQRMRAVQSTHKGKFKKYQLLILYLLRRCYSIIYKLLESSEPVSESLTPIHNQLSTVKRCLLELKRVDGVNNLRELYPFQFKLASIDNLRKDGKFIVDTTVPEGQGALCALLSECFDILQEMKIEVEEKELEEEGDEDIDDAITGSMIANGGSFTNSKEDPSAKGEYDDVEVKRNRFKDFNEADYDLDSISNFDEDEEIEEEMSDSEYEGNDYY
ncbi:uncharacterized protein LODBEIA_P06770 [Lodderomyces beijingensis]|uniref:Uncharacterized protein n=1 Tax=Lodderomyces beijingensis TaxID=1775926 RepID=A0ABP0ZFW8_9ASCO